MMLYERDIELGELGVIARETYQSRGKFVLIAGEAGIGKTSLIAEFVASQDKQADIVWGLCDAMFTPRPLGPVYDIAQMMPGRPQELAQASATIDVLMPGIFDALSRASVPMIMVVEDIHWADHGTLDFIRYLGRRLSTLPLLVIASFRDDEVGPEHPLYQVLGDLPARTTNRFKLSPLGLETIERLGRGSAHSPEHIFKVTGGNPFFVTELLASADDQKTATPASVREAVNARLNRVTASEREFLEFVSCIPGSIDLKLVNPVFDEEAEMLALACIGRGLLRRRASGALVFRHELARLATNARVPAIRKKSNHEKMLKALLDAESKAIDHIVHHAAGALDADSVLKFAPRAARRAAEVGSHREAAGHLATALEFVNHAEPELAASLYENWAYEAALSLKIDEDVLEARRHAITLWRALGRKDKVAENLRRLSRMHWYRGEAAKAAQYSDEAVQMLEDEGPSHEKAMAFSLRSQLHMLNDRMDKAIIWGEKALATAEAQDDDEVRIHALNNIGTAKLFRGNEAGLADMDESLRLALLHHRHEDAARVYTNLSEYAVDFKNFDLAEQVITEGIAFDTEHDLDSWTFYLVGRQAQLRLEQGRLNDAKEIAEGVLNRRGQTLLMQLPARIMLAKTAIRLGDKNAGTLLSDAMKDAVSTGETQYIAPVSTAHIEYAALYHQKSQVKEHFDNLMKLPRDSLNHWHWGEFWFWVRESGLDIDKGLMGDLPEPYQLLFSGQTEDAAIAFDRLGMRYFAAWCYFMQGNESGLKLAHNQAAAMMAKPLQSKILEVAAQIGVLSKVGRTARGPYRTTRQHPLGLTKREQEVLALLVKGSSNQEMADSLTRSKRTIENHVSAVLAKFNARSRTDVILRVQNEPWLFPKSVAP